MADGNKVGDPKSSSDDSSHDGAGGSGGTNPPDLGNAGRLGITESDSGENPRQADRYMSIGNGGSGGLPNVYGRSGGGGSSGGGYPYGTCNGFTDLHGSGGGGGGSTSSGYPHGVGNGYGDGHPHGFVNGYGANLHWSGGGGGSTSSEYPHGIGNGYGNGHPHGFVNGYGANLHWSGGGGGGGGSTVPFNPHYGDPDRMHLSGGESRAAVLHQRAPAGNLSYNLYYNSNSYGGARVWPQQAPMNTNNLYAAVPRFLPNGNGNDNGVMPRPAQRPGSPDLNTDALIREQLASLTIGNGYAEFRIQRQQRNTTVGAGVDGDPYWGTSLEGVKGRVAGVARDLHGCQFLCQTLKERREDAVRQVFDEVAGEIVRLMGHGVAAEFVHAMSRLWTDEQVARVVRALGASSPWEVMAAARNQSGSSALQNLISRIEGRLEETECLVRGLARVGETNLLELIKHHAGSRVIQRCLETFSPAHNLFVVEVVVRNPYEVAYSKHGCHTMARCIDVAMDARTRDLLVQAVCAEGLGLAQNQFGNYVVQHVIGAVPGVPWAMEMLHAEFRRMYASLSRHKASSNVVQACLAFFPEALRDEIVWELLNDDSFPELIEDPFANYVLQSAVSTTNVLAIKGSFAGDT